MRIVEHEDVEYVGEGKYWFDANSLEEVRNYKLCDNLEMERMRLLAAEYLECARKDSPNA